MARALLGGGRRGDRGLRRRPAAARARAVTVYLVGAGPGRPRAAHPARRRAAGAGRRRAARPAGQPGRPRPGAPGRDADRRRQGPRRARGRGGAPGRDRPPARRARPALRRAWSGSRAATPSSSAAAARRSRCWRGPGIPWEVVPGVTSAFGVPAAAGIPVTQRGLASSVTVVTGRVGEPGADGGPDWEALARAGRDARHPHGHDDPGRHRRGAAAGRPVARHAGRRDRAGDDAGGAGGAHDAGRAGRGRPRPARRHRRRPGGGARRRRTPSAAGESGPLAGPHGGGDPLGPAGPGPGRRARAGRGHGARAPADPPGRPGATAGPRCGPRRPRCGTTAGSCSPRSTRSTASWPSCATRGPSGRCWSPRSGRPPPTRCGWPGVEPDLVPAEHSARGLVEEFPARRRRRRAARPVPVRGPRARHDRRGPRATRAGRCGGSRPTAPWPGPRPSPSCWPGWRRPTRCRSPPPRRCAAFLALRTPEGAPVPRAAARRLHRADDRRGGPGGRLGRRARGLGRVRRGHRRRAGRPLRPRCRHRLVGWRRWPRPPPPRPPRVTSRTAGSAGCAAPRRCGAWSPRRASASTTSSPRCSCGRGSTEPVPIASMPGQVQHTRRLAGASRPSGSSRSGSRA